MCTGGLAENGISNGRKQSGKTDLGDITGTLDPAGPDTGPYSPVLHFHEPIFPLCSVSRSALIFYHQLLKDPRQRSCPLIKHDLAEAPSLPHPTRAHSALPFLTLLGSS